MVRRQRIFISMLDRIHPDDLSMTALPPEQHQNIFAISQNTENRSLDEPFSNLDEVPWRDGNHLAK